MTTNLSIMLVLSASEGEVTFGSQAEYWIWKATAETTNGRYDQAVTITPPRWDRLNTPISKRNCSTFWKGPIR